MLAILAAATAIVRTPIELWHTGDDGLSEKVFAAIEERLATSPEFEDRSGAELKILAPSTNVRPTGAAGHLKISFEYEIDRSGQKIAEGQGRCSEQTLSDCANIVVRAARKAVSK